VVGDLHILDEIKVVFPETHFDDIFVVFATNQFFLGGGNLYGFLISVSEVLFAGRFLADVGNCATE
jgi:hypothetical protein